MARNRVTYASQSVWANGEILYRVQTLGTSTTFNSEDIFELGHLDIIDVVDDVPAVTVTLNTNDFGSVRTSAILSQVSPDKLDMTEDATSDNANLVSGSTYLHGTCLADFGVVCGNLPGISLWAPVQSECDLGTLANNIDQTMFLDGVFMNSIELSYTTGANATENYGAETDNKLWLLNDAAYVNYLEVTVSGADVSNGYVDLVSMGYDNTSTIPTLSTGNIAFLRKDDAGAPAVTHFDSSANTMTNVEVVEGVAQASSTFVVDFSTDRLYFPTDPSVADVADTDNIQLIFAADKYSEPMNNYFVATTSGNTGRNWDVGALRQGQVEIFIYDSGSTNATWRLTGVTISADLTREPLTELGHLAPYDRPLTLPIPITVTIDSTAGDLENYAKMAGKDFESIDDIDLSDLMTKDGLCLVAKVYEQTDEEADGSGSNRTVNVDNLVGETPVVDGVFGSPYTIGDREYPLKTVIVKNLKITDEGMSLDVGSNATQTFGFRANNDLFMVKGDISDALIGDIARNAS